MNQTEKVQFTTKKHAAGDNTNPEENHSSTDKLVYPQKRIIMSAISSSPNGRGYLGITAAVGILGLLLLIVPYYAQTVTKPGADTVRSFRKETTITKKETDMTQIKKAQYTDVIENKAIRPFRDLVLPSIPGYGFSGKPKSAGWGPDRMGSAWHELMQRLGYKRYVAQGGDWGAIISEVMAVQAPEGLLGIHINMPGTVPPNVVKLVRNREPVPAGFSDVEKAAYASLDVFYNKGFGYAEMMNTRPQTIGYALADSPVGMAAFFYDKFAAWTYSGGEPEKALTRDEMLDNITLYWLTNTGTSSSRSYWDAAQLGGGPFTAFDIPKVPVAVTIFPGEIYRAPRSWAEKSFHKLIYWNEVNKGGHFAAWEQPELFAAEIRAAFKSLR